MIGFFVTSFRSRSLAMRSWAFPATTNTTAAAPSHQYGCSVRNPNGPSI
jgi:hypothetical protein